MNLTGSPIATLELYGNDVVIELIFRPSRNQIQNLEVRIPNVTGPGGPKGRWKLEGDRLLVNLGRNAEHVEGLEGAMVFERG